MIYQRKLYYEKIYYSNLIKLNLHFVFKKLQQIAIRSVICFLEKLLMKNRITSSVIFLVKTFKEYCLRSDKKETR